MQRPTTNSDELETVDGYRKISPFAIASLVLGVLSPLAFTAPFFLCVPVLACFSAIAALISINARPGQVAGKALAHCGLALAVCFATAAYVRTQTTARLFQNQARATTEDWLNKLAEGKLEESLNYLGPSAAASLVPSPGPGQPQVSKEDIRAYMIESLRQSPLVAELSKHNGKVSLSPLATSGPPVASKSGRTLSARYKVTSSETKPMELAVRLGTPPAGYNQLLLIEHWQLPPTQQ